MAFLQAANRMIKYICDFNDERETGDSATSWTQGKVLSQSECAVIDVDCLRLFHMSHEMAYLSDEFALESQDEQGILY